MTYKKKSINQISVLSTSELFYIDSDEAITVLVVEFSTAVQKNYFSNGMLNHRLLPELLWNKCSLNKFSVLKSIYYTYNTPVTSLFIVDIEMSTKRKI